MRMKITVRGKNAVIPEAAQPLSVISRHITLSPFQSRNSGAGDETPGATAHLLAMSLDPEDVIRQRAANDDVKEAGAMRFEVFAELIGRNAQSS